jgi:hypothetical protein
MVEVSQYKIVTVDKIFCGRIVWDGLSRGRFVGGRNVKARCKHCGWRAGRSVTVLDIFIRADFNIYHVYGKNLPDITCTPHARAVIIEEVDNIL